MKQINSILERKIKYFSSFFLSSFVYYSISTQKVPNIYKNRNAFKKQAYKTKTKQMLKPLRNSLHASVMTLNILKVTAAKRKKKKQLLKSTKIYQIYTLIYSNKIKNATIFFLKRGFKCTKNLCYFLLW